MAKVEQQCDDTGDLLVNYKEALSTNDLKRTDSRAKRNDIKGERCRARHQSR